MILYMYKRMCECTTHIRTHLYVLSHTYVHVHPYSEGSDDQSRRGSEVLIAIDVVGVGHAHHTVVYVSVPVVATVLHPLKVMRSTHLREDRERMEGMYFTQKYILESLVTSSFSHLFIQTVAHSNSSLFSYVRST